MEHYYLSRHCAVCDELTLPSQPLCERCVAAPQLSAAALLARVARLERQHTHVVRMCLHCGGGGEVCTANMEGIGGEKVVADGGVVCESLDCGVFFERRKLSHELRAMSAMADESVKGFG